MTPEEYVTAFSFFGFTMLMTGGIALAIFWPSKKTKQKKSVAPAAAAPAAAPEKPVAATVVPVAKTQAA